MRIRWFGQGAFLLTDNGSAIAIDPFGDLSAAFGGRVRFDYPPVEIDRADLLLVTHEHMMNAIPCHRVVGRKNRAAGIPEHALHAQAFEALPYDFGARFLRRSPFGPETLRRISRQVKPRFTTDDKGKRV